MDAQSLIALSSVIVALAALVFSVVSFRRQQDRADEQQARAEKLTSESVKPLLWIQGQDYVDLKALQLRNHGLGPAVIKHALFEKNGVSTENMVELFPQTGIAWDTYVNLPPKRVIAAGGNISLVKLSLNNLQNQGLDDGSALKILDQAQEAKKGIRIRIEYFDIFGNEMEPIDYTT
jgi:hypothetical protein